MEYFKKGYGLVTEADPISENCNHFKACWLTLKGKLTDFEHAVQLTTFTQDMMLKFNPKMKVYNRRPEPDSRSVSQDEIYGWMITSTRLKTGHAKEIWSHMLKRWGSYNNTGRLADYLPFNGANYYSWSQYAEAKCFWYLTMPILWPWAFVNMWLTCRKPMDDTSSKILTWVDMQNLPDNTPNRVLKRYFESKMIPMYGDNYIEWPLRWYHRAEKPEFPIFIELSNL